MVYGVCGFILGVIGMGVCEYMYGCDLLEMSHGVDTLVDHSFVGGAYVGVGTPVFMTMGNLEDVDGL